MKNPINCHLCGKCIPKPANGQIYCEECRKNLYKENNGIFMKPGSRKNKKVISRLCRTSCMRPPKKVCSMWHIVRNMDCIERINAKKP
jgi:hypothetical protein